jgi:hypothetical protein
MSPTDRAAYWRMRLPAGMQVDRLTIAMDPELGRSVRDAAARSGSSVSGWMAAAAADRLRNDLLGEALATWEAETAPFSDEELDSSVRVPGVTRAGRRVP